MSGRTVDPRFPERMRGLLAERGMSYRSLAARIHFAKSHLNDIANGRKQPTVDVARRVDEALGAGGELAGMVTPGRLDDDMQRRTLLAAALTSLGMAPAIDRLGISSLLASVAEREPEAATVDDWGEVWWEYGFTYLTAPRGELLADLSADLAAVTARMQRPATSDAVVRGLSEAGGRLAGLIAMVCADLGYGPEARRSWQVARRLADNSGSTSARMWVRGQEAILGLYGHRPVPLVLELANRGLDHGNRAPVGGTVTLASARAQALAMLDRGPEAVAALRQAEDIFEQLPDQLTRQTDTVFGHSANRIHHTGSFVYGLAGRPNDAYVAQAQALALYSSAKGISRGQINMHRAACLVRDGDLAGGLQHATATLNDLPSYARGRFVLTVAEAVLATVPAGARQRSDVSEYSHLLGVLRRGETTEADNG